MQQAFLPIELRRRCAEVKGKALGYEGRLTSGYFNNITEVDGSQPKVRADVCTFYPCPGKIRKVYN